MNSPKEKNFKQKLYGYVEYVFNGLLFMSAGAWFMNGYIQDLYRQGGYSDKTGQNLTNLLGLTFFILILISAFILTKKKLQEAHFDRKKWLEENGVKSAKDTTS